ncbi:MAG: cyclic nucleotide-binding domain-containing protein [Chloroflexi bacterium]|nr:cyclic nucleotide-binding domain-containing protein [Chloroflexota bacterium]
MTSIPERISFLKKIHLFSALTEDDLKDVAEALVDEAFKAEDVIVKEGTMGDTFYVIYRGTVKVTRKQKKGNQLLANLVQQDFFGEEELFSKGKRTATITATSDCVLLALHHEKLAELLKRAPKVKPNFEVVIQTHRLWRRLHFKWIRDDEAVYFLARKHPILLWRGLVVPTLFLAVPAGTIFWGLLIGAGWPFGLAAAMILGILGWMGWLAMDWENDYYIVTSQRVIWMEKVVGIFDSRMEAPLGTILSVGVETDAVGRILDYGNVIVRTFVGKIPFNNVHHPYHASRLVEEYWGRAKEKNLGAEKDAMKDAIRKRLGLPIPDRSAPLPNPPAAKQKVNLFKMFFLNLFRLRMEEGETVTYRKHTFVLWQQVWFPTVMNVLLFFGWLARIIYLLFNPNPDDPLIGIVNGRLTVDSLILAMPAVSIPFWIWWIYQYVDWKNDIFQVTPDQIIDIDKTPFGSEERRAAALENILSTEYQRIGLLGNIFNYGTVYIAVGGSKLEFQDVYDPPSVQSDIDRRRMARTAAKNAAASATERERMAEWVATYHRSAEEFRREEEARKNANSG